MKAIAWLVMLLVIISFTGFSFTTTDLAQNSEIEFVDNYQVGDTSIEVVSFAVDLRIQMCDINNITSNLSFNVAAIAFVEPQIIKNDDVGWQYTRDVHKIKQLDKNVTTQNKTYKNSRNPRDGLTHMNI